MLRSLICLLVVGSAVVCAQTPTLSAGDRFEFLAQIPVRPCNYDASSPGSPMSPPERAQFEYVQTVETNVVIRFLTWRSDSLRTLFNNVRSGGLAPFFCLSNSDFNRFTARRYPKGPQAWELAAGTLILPVKIRSGATGFDFSKDVTLGTTAGARYRLSSVRNIYGSVLGGVGLSSASLNAANTNNKVTTVTDRSAFTWTAGVMLEIDKFQFGGFFGQDRISDPNQRDWIYQGKTWLAIGLGYSLFGSASSNANPKGSGNQQP
jgi:hypothetical protein